MPQTARPTVDVDHDFIPRQEPVKLSVGSDGGIMLTQTSLDGFGEQSIEIAQANIPLVIAALQKCLPDAV